MNRLLTAICVAALGASVPIADIAPAQAVPIFVPAPVSAQPDVIQVRDGVRWRRNWSGGNFRRGGNWNGNNWRGRNYGLNGNNWRRGNYRWARNNWRGRNWYGGNRGYYGRYYDNDDDFWGTGGAFVAGALLGGVIANNGFYGGGYGPRYYVDSPGYYGGGNGHVAWCYNRYRSYRASDNTFQPYNGPRRECNSPY
jgi:hypothetical protein